MIKLVFLLVILPLVFTLSCTARYQCMSVSQDYNYVDCINGQCQCLSQQGFTGLATTTSKCSCATGNDLIWQNGLVYCLDVNFATKLQVSNTRTTVLTAKIRQLYDGLIGMVLPYQYLNSSLGLPSPVNILDIMAPDVVVRVDPFGVFAGSNHAGEYYYVFAVKSKDQGIVVSNVDYVYLYGVGDNVFVRVNIGFGIIGTTTPVLNVTESGNYRFGPNNTIVSADIIAHNVGEATAPAIADSVAFIDQLCKDLTINPGSSVLQPQPNGWCPPQYDMYNGGYANYTDCVNFMNSIPVGSYDLAHSNTVVCRRLHADISLWDPMMHCAHAGKTGGGQCIDTPYYAYYPPFSPV